jgi:peptide/nickel transport system substrate-binding protein
MRARSSLPATMLVIGTSLLAAGWTSPAAGTSGTTALKTGGTLLVTLPRTDSDEIDPSLAYSATSWSIEYSTALKLLNYPDAPAPRGSRLVPEGAASFAVSRDGRTYTFTIRKGFRFSDGKPVTSRSYAYALNRALGNRVRQVQSPGFAFVGGIVGAKEVRAGKRAYATGIATTGNKLIVRLRSADGAFLSKIAAPFFQALPASLSRTEKVGVVDPAHPLPSAGPYYVARREPSRLVVLRRNPFYGGSRPRRPAAVRILIAEDAESSYRDVKADRADFTRDLAPSAAAEAGREFGLSGRFRVRPSNCISYIAMNTSNALFRGNPRLRRAVNYAIDRRALVALGAPYSLLPTDQYLPQGFPGFKDIAAYPVTADLTQARRLAAGRVPPGGPWVYYYSLSSPGPERMELVRAALHEIGVEIEPRGFRGFAIYDAAGKRNSPHAFATIGWCHSYPADPSMFNALFFGGSIRDNGNRNMSYLDDPAYNRRLQRAARLRGDARLRAYASLEHDLVTKAAPWAAWGQPTNQFFFGDRVDQRSFLYQPIYETPPYNVLALK